MLGREKPDLVAICLPNKDHFETTLRVIQADNEKAEVWQPGHFNDAESQSRNTIDRHFDHLLKAFRAIENPPVHARMGRRALELALAAIRSFETGRRVNL